MPNFFTEGSTPKVSDSAERLAIKAVSAIPAALEVLGVDPDAAAFAQSTGATDVRPLDSFVRGLKAAGLWGDIVLWPLRDGQNTSSGVTVKSLGGLAAYDGTLVNSPTRSPDGVVVDSTTRRMTIPFTPSGTQGALGVVMKLMFLGGLEGRLLTCDVPGTSRGLGIDGFFAGNFRRLSASYLGGFGTQGAGFTSLAVGGRAVFWAQDAVYSSGGTLDLTQPFGQLRLGDSSLGTRRGTYACAWWFNRSMSSAEYTAFYTLYKSTLGVGLGLP
jgi:hypothetical protein